MPAGMRPGTKAFAAVARTTMPPITQPAASQRLETKRPSGKSSRRNIGRPKAAGMKIQEPTHAAIRLPGTNEPCSASIPSSA